MCLPVGILAEEMIEHADKKTCKVEKEEQTVRREARIERTHTHIHTQKESDILIVSII